MRRVSLKEMDLSNTDKGPCLFGLIAECVYNLKRLKRQISVGPYP